MRILVLVSHLRVKCLLQDSSLFQENWSVYNKQIISAIVSILFLDTLGVDKPETPGVSSCVSSLILTPEDPPEIFPGFGRSCLPNRITEESSSSKVDQEGKGNMNAFDIKFIVWIFSFQMPLRLSESEHLRGHIWRIWKSILRVRWPFRSSTGTWLHNYK